MIQIIELSIPEYRVDTQPDYHQVGTKIDNFLKRYFLNKSIVMRALCSFEREESLDELVNIIRRDGTDRANIGVKTGRGYYKVDCDLFGIQTDITKQSEIAANFIQNFYERPIKHGSHPLKTDLFILYDANKMKNIIYTKNGEPRFDAFSFLHPQNKSDAVTGLVKIM